MTDNFDHGVVCELCTSDGGELISRTDKYRVVLVNDVLYPGFCRVIWNAHIKEMTDLPIADRSVLMAAVCTVESAVRRIMQPEKINLACFGNMTPHLHWHVIPRYQDDVHFPHPVWAEPQREPLDASLLQRRSLLPLLRTTLLSACQFK